METIKTFIEEIRVMGSDLAESVKNLIHEGTVRRIIIKDDKGNTFIEIPVTVAAIGAIFAPVLAAVGAIAAMASHFTIVVEKTRPANSPNPPNTSVQGAGRV